jgi:hypothetical protein
MPEMEDHAMLERDSMFQWNYDMLKLDEVTKQNSLYVAWNRLVQLMDCSHFVVEDIDAWRRFTKKIQEKYVAVNPYHNHIHAADVAQGSVWFVEKGEAKGVCQLTEMEIFGIIMAAACHDLAHPALNNVYHIATRQALGSLYNDKAVLENHHSALTFLTYNEPLYKFAPTMPAAEFQEFRQLIVGIILATDMQKHFTELGHFKSKCGGGDQEFPETADDKQLTIRLFVHACDIGNPTRGLLSYMEWTQRILTEYFTQGDLEKKNGLPVSMFMDRFSTNIAKNQLGFIDIIVHPLYTALAIVFPELYNTQLEALEDNREFWEDRVDLMQESLERGDSRVKVWLPPADQKVTTPTNAAKKAEGAGV